MAFKAPMQLVSDPGCQFNWEALQRDGALGTSGYVALPRYVGPWGTGSGAATVSTAGHFNFTIPTAGVWLFTCWASAFSTVVNQDCAIDVYIDGALQPPTQLFINAINQHQAFVPSTFALKLTAAAHTLGLLARTSGVGGSASLSSNSADYGGGNAVLIG